MIKILEERKRDLLETLKEEYSEKPRRWWQNKQPEHKTTWEYSERSDHFRPVSDETVIRYDIKGALRGSALFFIIVAIMFFYQNNFDIKIEDLVFPILIMLILNAVPILKERKRKPKMILNREGIWLSIIEDWIAWENLIACYVKKDDSGESTTYSLIFHYYLPAYDTFATSEFEINNLDMKLEDIAAEIEYRKRYRQNKTAIRR